MKTATNSAFVFAALLTLSGAALARSTHASSTALPAAAADADKHAKKESKDAKDKANCKHDKNHPCKETDSKSGQAK